MKVRKEDKQRVLVYGNYIVFYSTDMQLWLWDGVYQDYCRVDVLVPYMRDLCRGLAMQRRL